MKSVIHKQLIEITSAYTFVEMTIPEGAEIFTALIQEEKIGDISFYYKFNPNQTKQKKKKIIIVGTGVDFNLPFNSKYLTTVVTPALEIYHIFILSEYDEIDRLR